MASVQVASKAYVDAIAAGQASAVIGYDTRDNLEADLAHDEGAVAYVLNDPTLANNGTYRKVGAPGAGEWKQSDLDLVAIWSRFADAPGVNLYDPALAEDGTYLNTAGAIRTHVDWAWTGLIPIEAGTEYTYWLDIESGSPHSQITFFGPGGLGDFLGTQATLDVGVRYSDGGRTIRFVAPPGSAFAANNFYAGTPHTTEEFEARAQSIMLEVGGQRTTFQPYELAPRLVDSAVSQSVLRRFADVEAAIAAVDDRLGAMMAPIRVTKIGDEYYLRSRWDDDSDLVVRWMVGGGNGVVQPTSVSLIPADTASEDVPTQHVVAANVVKSGEDDPGNWRLNSTTVGGNHGHPCVVATASAHGKVTADIGSIWEDAAAKQWTILRIPDADTLELAPGYTRDATGAYVVDFTFTGTTLTHVSGATNTGAVAVSATTQSQFFPSVRSHVIEILTESGVDLAAAPDGDYDVQSLAFAESYVITSLAGIIDHAQASVGGTSTPDYTDESIPGLLAVEHVYHVSAAQHTVLDSRVTLLEPAVVGACYIVQSQVMGVPSGRQRTQYLPDTLPIGGYDFEAGVDITSSAPQATLTPATWRYADTPPSQMIQVLTAADDTPLIGLALEVDESVGIGRPWLRAANLGSVHAAEFRAGNMKQYLVGYAGGASEAGTRYVMRARRRYFHPSRYGF